MSIFGTLVAVRRASRDNLCVVGLEETKRGAGGSELWLSQTHTSAPQDMGNAPGDNDGSSMQDFSQFGATQSYKPSF